MISLFGIDPACWTAHRLHHPEQPYAETNCYADVLIELIAAAGHEPLAALGAASAIDYELDQWTFFKPPAQDLYALYGMEVREIQPYRGLAEQIALHLEAGETLIPEVDAYWLPDTATTSYRSEHVKTSVVPEAIDPDREVLRYFHSGGYFELSGEDYRGALRLDCSAGTALPPYVDLVRFRGPVPIDQRRIARALLLFHLSCRPRTNPFLAFEERLSDDLPALLEGDLGTYHAYAFANPRMAGAGFGLLAAHVRWLFGADGAACADELDRIVEGSKVLLFRLARRRPFDVAGLVLPMADAWTVAQAELDRLAYR